MSNNSFVPIGDRKDLGYRNGRLKFAGRYVSDLVAQHGTPSFFYSERRMMQNVYTLLNALPSTARVHYAMKANRFAPLLTALSSHKDCGVDCCSPDEVDHAIACGFRPTDISFTGTSLSTDDYDRLSNYNGIQFNADSLHDIVQWGKRNPGASIGIRVNPGVGVSRPGNDTLVYAGAETTKFGIYPDRLTDAISTARGHKLRITRLHTHTGCGYLTEQLPQLGVILRTVLAMGKEFKDLRSINIGGGLGIPYDKGDTHLDMLEWGNLLAKIFIGTGLDIEVEPGDYIVGDAGIMVLERTYVEEKNGTLFVGVNGGFNLAPEPAHYHLVSTPVPLRDYIESLKTPCTVVGNVNEALDVWAHGVPLPNMRLQTHLAFLNSGAYASSMASNHCMRGSFKEYLLT